MQKDDERRKYRRVKNEFSVKIDKENLEKKTFKFQEGTSVDVSACGVLIRYPKPLELNSLLHLRFLKPNSFDFFEGVARVVRVELTTDQEYEIGVEFLNLSEDEEKRLNYYLCLAE